MPPAAVTLYCVLLFTFSHLHRFWLFCPCVLQFLSSLFFISPSLTTAFLFILLLPPHPSSSFYLPSLSSTLQERLRWFQSTRRTLHVQRLEGIPLRSLSIFSARPLVVGLPSRGEDNDFFYHACPCTRLFACDKDDVWYVCDETCFSSSPSLTCPQSLLC